MILRLTPYQRFRVEGVINAVEAKTYKEMKPLMDLGEAVALTPDQEQLYMKIVQNPMAPGGLKIFDPTAVVLDKTDEIELDGRLTYLLREIFDNHKGFVASDRNWLPAVMAQMEEAKG